MQDSRGENTGSIVFIFKQSPMKDNRPSRKESKAQDNIREYLQDIAMGSTTHFGASTVGTWKIRYRDFEKSLKQAWNDYEAFFDGVPVINEVEAPEICPTMNHEKFKEEKRKLHERLTTDYTYIQKYDKSITIPSEMADVIHYWDELDQRIIVSMVIIASILGRAGHYLYTAM